MAHYEQGTYHIQIIEQGFDEGKYGLSFWLKFSVTGGEYERTAFLSLIDEEGNPARYAEKSMEVLRHLGFSGAEGKLSILDPRHPQCVSFVGIECEGYCSHKVKDDGNVVERWYINTPRDGMETKPPEKDTLRKLDALFGKELKQAAKDNPQPPPPQDGYSAPAERQPPVVPEADNIPF